MTSGIWLAGVDGCKGGWFSVLARITHGSCVQTLRFALYEQFSKVLARPERPAIVAVDIPIGLLDSPRPGGRDCDREARRVLGRRRHSSVFTPPIRRALAAHSYHDALRLNGQGMSRQAFGILPKIREVDCELTKARQQHVYEAHPELAFAALAGTPMEQNKKTRRGRQARECLLRDFYGHHYIDADPLRSQFGLRLVAVDDILDAYALVCTAVRIAAGNVTRLPHADSPRDRKGLPMEIWY